MGPQCGTECHPSGAKHFEVAPRSENSGPLPKREEIREGWRELCEEDLRCWFRNREHYCGHDRGGGSDVQHLNGEKVL